jgi:hypothetical protein
MGDVMLDRPPVPVSEEVKKIPEELVGEIVSDADRPLNASGELRAAGNRVSCCGLAVDLVARAVENRGAKAEIYQVNDVYLGFGGKNENSTRHGFNTVTVNNKEFLTDVSFCQFIDPETGDVGDIRYREKGKLVLAVQGNLATSPLASALLRSGYVELTDEVLKEYLRLICHGVVDDLTDVSVQHLKQIKPLEYDHDEDELDGLLIEQLKLPRYLKEVA